ncbi:MAG: hypothetical protein WDZ28_02865 [Simkaniaceae bacterium]
MWKILDTGQNSAQHNMELDKKLLEALKPDDAPMLHFYDWERESATYGYFIKYEQFIDTKKVLKKNIDICRRPTGGGILFHQFDLAFTVLIPAGYPGFSENTLKNYALVNRGVQEAVGSILKENEKAELLEADPQPLSDRCRHFCYAKPTIYDVMIGSKKVAGAAQRRKKQGLLHQGSISIQAPNLDYLREILIDNESLITAFSQNSFSLLPYDAPPSDRHQMRQVLKEGLKQAFTKESSIL